MPKRGHPSSTPPASTLMTREQFLSELKRQGFDLSERNLKEWHAFGLLRRPVRRWHEGAVRALYEPAFVQEALAARALLDAGYSRERARTIMQASALPGGVGAEALLVVPQSVQHVASRFAAAYRRLGGAGSPTYATLTLYNDAGEALRTVSFPLCQDPGQE